ncbi:MAG: hypothetical protein JWP81_1799 [Ferruginibacter sp.]|nr:hypothetical protein [Ferruginibacter sp.]
MPDFSSIAPQPQTVEPSAAKCAQPDQEAGEESIYKECLQRLPIQRKLSIGAVDDPLEYEADAMADRVMRMPDANSFYHGGEPVIQRKCAHCEEEEGVQRKLSTSVITPFIQAKRENGGVASDRVTQQVNATKGKGSGMEGYIQSFMQSRFNTDFSGVKIHTGDYAVQMSKELNAEAFTVGSDIYFNNGKYNPGSDPGKHLLAHELTHTVQQNNSASNTIHRQVAPLPQRTPAQQIATTLRNAASGLGTDEDAIFNALTGRTAAEISDIEAAYLTLSGSQTLEAMLRDELSGDDLSKALSLLRGESPSAEIARVLWNAMRGLGTDESAIYGVIAGRTVAQWTDLQDAYRQMTSTNLLTDLRDELNDEEWNYVQTLLPGATGGAATDEDRATVIANRLEAAMQGLGTDESAIYAALTGHSDTELREIERRYRLITGRDLNADLQDELTGGEFSQAQALLHPLGNSERLAKSLHDAVDGAGTREAAIVAILQGRSAAELGQVSAAYQRLYNESLNTRLEDELGGADWLETSILLSGRSPGAIEEIVIATMDRGTDEERLFAVFQTYNRDVTTIAQLKAAYLARTGNTLRSLMESELSGDELQHALFLLNEDQTADEMTRMLGSRMRWRSSGPGSGTTFEIWASAATEGTAPTLTPGTIINCWEVVLLAAYRAGAINWSYIHNLYTAIPSSGWVGAMSQGPRTVYHVGGINATMPSRGDIVFFDGIAHVALANGNGSEVLTFWPPPDTPFTRDADNAVEDRVKLFTIEELSNWWSINLPPAPLIEFGRPAWGR